MAGCKSCSGRSPDATCKPVGKAEKLQKGERSDNPRYPNIFVGKQAMYSDSEVQMIVTVLSDNCSEACDCFTLSPQHVLRGPKSGAVEKDTFEVSQTVGEACWKLSALI